MKKGRYYYSKKPTTSNDEALPVVCVFAPRRSIGLSALQHLGPGTEHVKT